MKSYFLITLFLVVICSCQRTSQKENYNPPKKKPIIITWKERIAAAEKDPGIRGVFEVSRDTIILLKRTLGIELSPDGGKSWVWLAKNIFGFNEFVIDDKRIMWGLEKWVGIHEPSYCRIHSSEDKGKTWKSYELNTNKFFPYHISSLPYAPLEVVNYSNKKLYRLEGLNPLAKWLFIKQLPNRDNNKPVELSVDSYSITQNSDNNKLYVRRPNGSTDTLITFTKADNIYYLEKSKDMIYVAGPSSNEQSSYFAVIKNEQLLRDFTVPGLEVKLIKTNLGRIYLTSTEGAFQYKGHRLVNIFQ